MAREVPNPKFPRILRQAARRPIASALDGRYGGVRPIFDYVVSQGRVGLNATASVASVPCPSCDTCFFGVEHLCALRVDDVSCPTYRAHQSPWSDCLRRRRSTTNGEQARRLEVERVRLVE